MTSILLITDIERVQRVFQSLEKDGVLQLRTSATLSLSAEEIGDPAPQLIFAQSRISGFSSDIALRHLKKILPPRAKVVILAVDQDDVELAQKQAKRYLDLADDDQALAEGIKGIVSGKRSKPPAKDAGKGEGTPAKRNAKAKDEPAAAVGRGAGEEGGLASEAAGEELTAAPFSTVPAPPVAEEPGAVRPEAQPPVPQLVPQQVSALQPPAAAPAHAKVPPPAAAPYIPTREWFTADTAAKTGEVSAAEEKSAPAEEAPAGEEETFAEMMRRASSRQGAEGESGQVESRQVESRQASAATPSRPGEEAESPARPIYVDEYLQSLDAQEKASSKKKRAAWSIPLAVALIFIPLVLYIVGPFGPRSASVKKPAAGVAPAAPGTKPAPSGAKPGQPASPAAASNALPAPPVSGGAAPAPAAPKAGAAQAPKSATAPAGTLPAGSAKPAAPVVPPAAPPAAKAPPAVKAPPAPQGAVSKPAKVQPAPAAQHPAAPQQVARPAATAKVKGVTSLPPFLAGVTIDPAYSKSHPGWQRLIGTRAEYKLYKEGSLYKALQVLAPSGQTISDQIYQRALLEFGGIDHYQVKSTETKGGFLVEHGVGPGGLGLTIYRKKSDHALKGLVVFYP
ncbi:hypothetical protein L4X63_05290 [Geomonas sp. Red32]|uniref:hypothetical protein n=1 Tax=Geomonas sp. Red32 TaxID=2912856 RepID=UPI00202CC876|nr:hypothetical protein [Geomonas sp. Red32]MCM0080997.1 hypothetical protein [Geomonas sp. Red32]